MTMTCARFCVVSEKKTIQLLHSTDPRLTGPFWYNIFCTHPVSFSPLFYPRVPTSFRPISSRYSSLSIVLSTNLSHLYSCNSPVRSPTFPPPRRNKRHPRPLDTSTRLPNSNLPKVYLRRPLSKSPRSNALSNRSRLQYNHRRNEYADQYAGQQFPTCATDGGSPHEFEFSAHAADGTCGRGGGLEYAGFGVE